MLQDLDICGIGGDLVSEACSPPIEGTQDVVAVYAKSDIKGYTYKAGVIPATSKMKIIEAVFLKFARRAYILTGRRNSNAPQSSFNGEGLGKHTHLFDYTVFATDPETVYQLQELCASKSVAIVPNNNGWYLVYGRENGLDILTGLQEVNNADTGGAFRITSSAQARSFADYFAKYTGVSAPYVYDKDLTQELFEDLFTPPFYDITSIVPGATTKVVLDVADKPMIDKSIVGRTVYFENIVGTVGDDATDGLNGKSFVIQSILPDGVSFVITADTTGLTFTSGGKVR
jgi:hypothetical protein